MRKAHSPLIDRSSANDLEIPNQTPSEREVKRFFGENWIDECFRMIHEYQN
jgi:hypothetical protein